MVLSLFCVEICKKSGQERQLDQGNVNEVFHPTVPVIPHHGMVVVVTAGLCPVVEGV